MYLCIWSFLICGSWKRENLPLGFQAITKQTWRGQFHSFCQLNQTYPWIFPLCNQQIIFLKNSLIRKTFQNRDLTMSASNKLWTQTFKFSPSPKPWTINKYWVQFSSVTQSCLTLCSPMNRSMPGLTVHDQLPEYTQTHIHRVSYAIQPSHPLSSPSPPALDQIGRASCRERV